MKKLLSLVTVLVCFMSGTSLFAARANINTSFLVDIDDFLPWNSGGSAKAMGMGGAFTAVADDLGAVEYNPAGLARIGHINAAALGVFSCSTELNAAGEKKDSWEMIPTYGGAAVKLGSVALGLSIKKPLFNAAYLEYSGLQHNVRAPDNYPMVYDNFSDKIDTSELNTYVLTAGMEFGRLAVGANANYIKGDVSRTVRGRNASRAGTNINSEFNSTDKVEFSGYTMDFGLLYNMGILKLGVTAKNMLGKVDVTQDYEWHDDFAVGHWWTYDPAATEKTLNEFAPTYTAGAALTLGKIATIDMDYVAVNLNSSTKALGRLGAELWVIPGFLAARGGVEANFNDLTQYVSKKSYKYTLGAGLKLWALTVDASAAMNDVKDATNGKSFTGAISAALKF